MEQVMLAKNVLIGILFTAFFAIGTAWCGDSPKESLAPMFYNDLPTLLRSPSADSTQWLDHIDGIPWRAYFLPDQFNDHYFNVRFTSPDSCKLIQAAFIFFKNHPDNDTTGIPDLHVLIWENDPTNSLLPMHPDSAAPLDSVLIDSASLEPYINRPDSAAPYPIPLSLIEPFDTLFVDFDTLDLFFSANEPFHVGWEPVPSSPVDSLAIIADYPYPSTNTSIEWWDTTSVTSPPHTEPEWRTVESSWGEGFDFFIAVQIEIFIDTTTTYVWIEPDRQPERSGLVGPYPNPFNPETTLLVTLEKSQPVSLKAFDVSGRLVDEIIHSICLAGQTAVKWQPHNLPSGTYIILMESGERSLLTRAVLLK